MVPPPPPVVAPGNLAGLAGDARADLPVDGDGRLYHLGLRPGEVSNLILTVGDEQRAKAIALLFDGAVLRPAVPATATATADGGTQSKMPAAGGIDNVYGYRSSRGFLTFTGRFKGRAISVVSIGMGYPNMDFFVREVRAIVRGPLVVIRVGTCGAIADGRIGMLAIPEDGAVMVQRNYDYPFGEDRVAPPTEGEPYRISRVHLPHRKLTETLIREAALQIGVEGILRGANASSDSFYASQGRPSPSFVDVNEALIDRLLARSITTLEMETGQLFHLAACTREREGAIYASAVHIVVADRPRNEFLTQAGQRAQLDRIAASVALEALASLELDPAPHQNVTVI